MKEFLLTLVLASLAKGQMFPGPGVKSYTAGGTVAIASSAYYVSGGSVSCSSVGLVGTCTITGVSIVSGHTVAVFWLYCDDGSCVIPQVPSVSSVSDGTNTYTQKTTAGATAGIRSLVYTAENVTGGTYTFTLSRTAATGLFYSQIFIMDLSGAALSGSTDTSASADGTSTTPSITSAGNVSTANSIGLCAIFSFVNFTYTSYTILDGVANSSSASLTNPSTGATSTCAATQSSGLWTGSMLIIKP